MVSTVAANGYLRHMLCAKYTASTTLGPIRTMCTFSRREGSGSFHRKNPRAWLQQQKTTKREAMLQRSKQVVLPVVSSHIGFKAQPSLIMQTSTPKSLAGTLGVRAVDVLKKMIILGERPRTADDHIPTDLAKLIAEEFKFQPVEYNEVFDRSPRVLDKNANYPRRPPIVTVIDIDHGKTTLLDTLRNSNVVDKEAGKITQHIGAFTVKMESGDEGDAIAFMDTPGHEAFTMLRERGIKTTDIALLVVSAADGVQEQTLEAIRVAKQANVQMIVCITKIDKMMDGGVVADTSHLREQLFKNGVEVEGIRKDQENAIPWVEVSAKTGYGMEELKLAIITQASMMNLSAPTDGDAEGYVLESRMEKGRGPLATVIVTAGTLQVGDYIVAGLVEGRIRHLKDHSGKELEKATPGFPVEIIGLKEVPEPGIFIFSFSSKEAMEAVVEHRRSQLSQKVTSIQHKADQQQEIERRTEALQSLVESTGKSAYSFNKAEVQARIVHLEKQKELNSYKRGISYMLKADAAGSIDGLKKALSVLPQDEVELRLVRASVGPINDGDVVAAKVTGSLLVSFGTRTPQIMRDVARKADVKLVENTVVYNIVNSMKDLMSALLPPNIFMDIIGSAQVKQVFEINKNTKSASAIAGCLVVDGTMRRGTLAQVMRNDKLIYSGKLDTLRSFKSSVPDVKKGAECGLGLDGFSDFQPGDVVKCVHRRAVMRKLGEKRIDQSGEFNAEVEGESR